MIVSVCSHKHLNAKASQLAQVIKDVIGPLFANCLSSQLLDYIFLRDVILYYAVCFTAICYIIVYHMRLHYNIV